jgi:RNA polymerase sigma factor (sigma-70 family)
MPAADGDRPDLAGLDPATEFARLFDAYAPQLHRYLARRVGAGVADDLVSETFLVALDQRRRYDPRAAAVRPWLYGIATNLAHRHVRTEVRALRATARAGGRDGVPDAGHDSRVAERVDAGVLASRLAPAIAELSVADRDVLLLVSWAGLSITEVADALGIPAGTVRSRLHRVRRTLRTSLADSRSGENRSTEEDDDA